MRAQRLPLCFHIRNISVNCCQPEAKRKERDADMVLLSVDVGYFQAGWQIKMMRALKKSQCGSTFSRKLKYLVWRKNKNQLHATYCRYHAHLNVRLAFQRYVPRITLVETMLLPAKITLKNKCFYPVQDFLFLLIFFPFFLKQADIHVAR